jgi:hypothetical protein
MIVKYLINHLEFILYSLYVIMLVIYLRVINNIDKYGNSKKSIYGSIRKTNRRGR